MNITDIIGLMKAAEWEHAKGSLRAVASLTGQDTSDSPREERTERWKRTTEAVEAFIRAFENEGLQE